MSQRQTEATWIMAGRGVAKKTEEFLRVAREKKAGQIRVYTMKEMAGRRRYNRKSA